MNPIQQAIEALEESGAWAPGVGRAMDILRSLQKEVEGVLPTLPFAVFDEFGYSCEDRVRDHFRTAVAAALGRGAVPQVVHQHGFAAENARLRAVNESLDKQLEEVMAERDDRDDVLARIAGLIDAEFTSAYGFADLELELEERLSAAPSPEATQPEDELRALEREHLGDFDGRTGVYATQPTQAEVVLIHGVPVHGLLPEDREPMEAIVDAAYAYAKKLRTQPTQAEAPSEREIRRMLCVAYAGASAYMDDGEAQDNRAQPFIDFLRDSPEAIRQKMQARAALATQQAVQAEQPCNCPCCREGISAPHEYHLERRPMVAQPAAVQGESVTKVVRDPNEGCECGPTCEDRLDGCRYATPPAPGQVERDREDAELLRRALYYLEADAAGRYGVQGLEEMVRAGDHPVVTDLRKRLGGSARFPDAARSSEGGSHD